MKKYQEIKTTEKCKYCKATAEVDCHGYKLCKSCLRNVFGIKDMSKY